MFLAEKNLIYWKKRDGKYEFEIDSDMINNNFREKLFDYSSDFIDEE